MCRLSIVIGLLVVLLSGCGGGGARGRGALTLVYFQQKNGLTGFNRGVQ